MRRGGPDGWRNRSRQTLQQETSVETGQETFGDTNIVLESPGLTGVSVFTLGTAPNFLYFSEPGSPVTSSGRLGSVPLRPLGSKILSPTSEGFHFEFIVG